MDPRGANESDMAFNMCINLTNTGADTDTVQEGKLRFLPRKSLIASFGTKMTE